MKKIFFLIFILGSTFQLSKAMCLDEKLNRTCMRSEFLYEFICNKYPEVVTHLQCKNIDEISVCFGPLFKAFCKLQIATTKEEFELAVNEVVSGPWAEALEYTAERFGTWEEHIANRNHLIEIGIDPDQVDCRIM